MKHPARMLIAKYPVSPMGRIGTLGVKVARVHKPRASVGENIKTGTHAVTLAVSDATKRQVGSSRHGATSSSG